MTRDYLIFGTTNYGGRLCVKLLVKAKERFDRELELCPSDLCIRLSFCGNLRMPNKHRRHHKQITHPLSLSICISRGRPRYLTLRILSIWLNIFKQTNPGTIIHLSIYCSWHLHSSALTSEHAFRWRLENFKRNILAVITRVQAFLTTSKINASSSCSRTN